MLSYKIETKNNTKKIIVIVAGIIFAALVMFILYKYVFNTSDCDGQVDVCGVCNGMGISCCYNEKCPTNQQCNSSTGSCECKSGHFDCSGVCDGTNIECCLEDCSGNAPDCDIESRKCFCKKGLDCDNNCTGNGPPCGICKDSEQRDVYCGCIPSEDLSKCLKNSDLYEFYSNNNCNYQVGGYCDCMGNVYDCDGKCGGPNKIDNLGCCTDECRDTKAEEQRKKEQAEKERKQKEEQEKAKKKAQEEEQRKRAEAEAEKRAQEAAKRAEEEAKRKAAQEAKRKAEEEAKRKAEEEAKKKRAPEIPHIPSGGFGPDSPFGPGVGP